MEATGKPVNVGEKERLASLLGGGALVLAAAAKRGVSGALLAIAGGGLIYRGVTGYCPVCESLGKDSSTGQVGGTGSLSREIPGHGGVLVEKSVTIEKSPEELYTFWRKLENLPQVMKHLETVVQTSETHSNWIASAPGGTTVSWGAEIIRDEANHYIAWRSVEGADIPNSGSVRFVPAAGSGTVVRVIFEYKPPAGAAGAIIAKLFGKEPNLQVDGDLRRFKQLMETGEIATVEGQSHG